MTWGKKYSSPEKRINFNVIAQIISNSFIILMSATTEELVGIARRLVIPKLTHAMYKGQAGTIGIVGGSFEYTGAPYYSAQATLKVGADQSMVFCTEPAAIPIKSYSPELIVHPILPSKGSSISVAQSLEKFSSVMWKLSAVVIGPGLGRDPIVMETTEKIIGLLKDKNVPIIIDAVCYLEYYLYYGVI